MACDDESGGNQQNPLVRSGRSEELHPCAGTRNPGVQTLERRVRTINLKDYQVLVANRDQLWREAHHYHHELQLANQEIAKANSHIRQLSRKSRPRKVQTPFSAKVPQLQILGVLKRSTFTVEWTIA